MKLTPVSIDIRRYPVELHPLLSGVKLFDSSCSPEAKVIFIDKDGGYFLKSAPKGSLAREAAMTKYFHSKKLAAEPLAYLSDENDFFLTAKIHGGDCTTDKYMQQPERLCDLLAEQLLYLHEQDFTDCPVPNHTEIYLAGAERNKRLGYFDNNLFLEKSFRHTSAEEAWTVVEKQGHLLQTDTLLHGDYCLPNIILDDWSFAGFIDLDNSGVGDRHVDLFWATWTLFFNFKTDKYRQRFIDAYGRGRVDEELLHLVAAAEVFG